MSEQETLRGKIVFRISPLLDLALSLMVVQNPERFGHGEGWVDRVKARLAGGTLEKLREAAERVDLFAVAIELDESSLPAHDALALLRGQHPDLVEPLQDYWRAIAPEIADHAGRVAESLQEEATRLSHMDPLAFLCRFSDRISVAGDGESIVLRWGKGMRVPLADLRQILMVPSAFCPRRLMFYRHGPLQIFFYAPLQEASAGFPDAPETLTLGFSALADPTRLKLLRLIARERLPAQEMARRLGLNESTVSRHLRLLVEAGLAARERQEGRFILYSFEDQRVEELISGARAYLRGGIDA